MICEKNIKRYCCEDISKIENYDKAIADNKQTWHCHHRGEILPCGTFTPQELMKYGLYYKRPAGELIFLPAVVHRKLHGEYITENTKNKMRKSASGRHHNKETKRKLREVNLGNKHWLGKKHSEETKRKLREIAKRRKPISEGTRQKMRELRLGKHNTQEANRKIGEHFAGLYWWNDGRKSVRSKECPGEGWVKGRIGWKNNKENQ